jgi:hypothetical protein
MDLPWAWKGPFVRSLVLQYGPGRLLDPFRQLRWPGQFPSYPGRWDRDLVGTLSNSNPVTRWTCTLNIKIICSIALQVAHHWSSEIKWTSSKLARNTNLGPILKVRGLGIGTGFIKIWTDCRTDQDPGRQNCISRVHTRFRIFVSLFARDLFSPYPNGKPSKTCM